MKKNQVSVIILFVVLFGLWFVNIHLSKNRIKNNTTRLLSEKAKVSKIIIREKADSLSIEKISSANWKVGDFEASPNKISAALISLSQSILESPVSKNPKKQEIYEVSSQNRTVELYDGVKRIQQIYIGKKGPVWPSNYIRPANSDFVYLVKADLTRMFSIKADDWKNFIIYKYNSENVTGLQSVFQEHTFTLKKKDSIWTFEADGATRDAKEIQPLLNQLNNFKAAAILLKSDIPDNTMDKNNPQLTLVITEKENKTKLTFTKTVENKFYVQSSHKEDYLYEIKESGYSAVKNKIEQLIKK